MPTPEQLERLRKHISNAELLLKVMSKEIKVADRIGTPISEKRQEYNDRKAEIANIKEVYSIQ